jgi:hypothetical protein
VLYIEEWQWDDDNVTHLREHQLSPKHVYEVFTEAPRFRPNLAGRTATHQMLGPDLTGTVLVFCILQTPIREGLWRTITGWQAEEPEEDWYNYWLKK